MRRGEKPHGQFPGMPESCPYFSAYPRAGHAGGALLYQSVFPRDISPCGRYPAAGIFDQRTRNQIRPDFTRLPLLGEFTVTVVHHDDRLLGLFLHDPAQFFDDFDRQARAGAVPAGALNIGHFIRFCFQFFPDGGFIRHAAFRQRHFFIPHTEIGKRSIGLAVDPENAENGIVRPAGQTKNGISRPQYAKQRHCQRMGARNKLMPDQRVFRPHGLRHNML